MSENELQAQLITLRKAKRNAVRRMRKIYYGAHPCAEQERNPTHAAACLAAVKATEECNVIIDQINHLRMVGGVS